MPEQSIKFKYKFNKDYNTIYVNGAWGGITPQGQYIVANFYLERVGVPISEERTLTESGNLSEDVSFKPDDLQQSLVRFVESGIVINLKSAKTIHKWLGQKILELESIQAGDPKNVHNS